MNPLFNIKGEGLSSRTWLVLLGLFMTLVLSPSLYAQTCNSILVTSPQAGFFHEEPPHPDIHQQIQTQWGRAELDYRPRSGQWYWNGTKVSEMAPKEGHHAGVSHIQIFRKSEGDQSRLIKVWGVFWETPNTKDLSASDVQEQFTSLIIGEKLGGPKIFSFGSVTPNSRLFKLKNDSFKRALRLYFVEMEEVGANEKTVSLKYLLNKKKLRSHFTEEKQRFLIADLASKLVRLLEERIILMDPDMILGEGWARWIDTQEWRSTPQGSRSQSLLSTFGFLGEFHNEPQLQKDLVSAFLSEVDQNPILNATEKSEVRAQLGLRQIQAYFNIHLDR